MDFDELIDRNSEEFSRNLKITFFDVAAKNQMMMDQIELALSQETNQERIDSLQRLWADCHDGVKGCINGTYLISTALRQLDECKRVYDSLLALKKEPIIVKENPQNNVANASVDAIVDAPIVEEVENTVPVIQNEVVATEEPTMLPPIVAEEVFPEETPAPVVEETVPVEKVPTMLPPITLEDSSSPIEELEPVVSEPAIVQTEEVPTEVLEESSMFASREPSAESVDETSKPVILANESVPEIAVVQEQTEEAPVPEPSLISSEEVSSEEQPAVVKTVEEEAPEEQPAVVQTETKEAPEEPVLTEVVETPEEEKSAPEVTETSTEEPVELETLPEPVVEEKAEEVLPAEVTEKKQTDATVTTIEVAGSSSLEEDIPPVRNEVKEEPVENKEAVLPLIEEVKEEEKSPEPEKKGILELAPEPERPKDENKNLETFVKESSDEGKAILVTKAQAQKLRYSKDLQTTLVHSIHPVSKAEEVEENVTEEQLESMVEQLASLYEQGKVEEAEEMSDRISVLSKKLKAAA